MNKAEKTFDFLRIAAVRSITDEVAMSKFAAAFVHVNKPTFKSFLEKGTSGFVAGAIGSSIPTMVTYPIDTQNIRQQSGMPPARTLREKYKGADTKLYKTIAATGLTFALAEPLTDVIKYYGPKHPTALRAGVAAVATLLAGLGYRVHKNLNKK